MLNININPKRSMEAHALSSKNRILMNKCLPINRKEVCSPTRIKVMQIGVKVAGNSLINFIDYFKYNYEVKH